MNRASQIVKIVRRTFTPTQRRRTNVRVVTRESILQRVHLTAFHVAKAGTALPAILNVRHAVLLNTRTKRVVRARIALLAHGHRKEALTARLAVWASTGVNRGSSASDVQLAFLSQSKGQQIVTHAMWERVH